MDKRSSEEGVITIAPENRGIYQHVRIQSMLAILLWFLIIVTTTPSAQAVDHKRPSVPIQRFPARNSRQKLSPGAYQMAEQLEIEHLLRGLDNHKQGLSGQTDKVPDVKTIWRRQNFLSTKQEVIVAIDTANLEVRTVVSRIDAEIGKAEEVKGMLDKRRRKEFEVTTAANFMAGGITRTTSNSMKLSTRLDLPANILDIIDGAVQTTLPMIAFYRVYGDRELVRKTPNMLELMFDHSKDVGKDWPVDVWAYLNAVPSKSTENFSRREDLTKSWLKSGLVHRVKKRPRFLRLG
ncbi:MAG: hypothetical protein K8F91_12265, partial [Candidatus Obscuribacterales bacterium]|nr:hypothetical protein [Candidatus Obscuribacterales bacterium]